MYTISIGHYHPLYDCLICWGSWTRMSEPADFQGACGWRQTDSIEQSMTFSAHPLPWSERRRASRVLPVNHKQGIQLILNARRWGRHSSPEPSPLIQIEAQRPALFNVVDSWCLTLHTCSLTEEIHFVRSLYMLITLNKKFYLLFKRYAFNANMLQYFM